MQRHYEESMDYAYTMMAHELRKKFPTLTLVRSRNGNLHREYQTRDYNFYCLFKRERLYHFNKLYKDFVDNYPQYSGEGEAINKSILERLINLPKETFLIYVYNNKEFYLAYPRQIYNFCIKHKLFRTRKTRAILREYGKFNTKNETVFNFPFNEAFFKKLKIEMWRL